MTKKQAKSPIQVAIHQQQIGIDRLEKQAAKVRERAEEEIRLISRRIDRKKVVLQALKAGAPK